MSQLKSALTTALSLLVVSSPKANASDSAINNTIAAHHSTNYSGYNNLKFPTFPNTTVHQTWGNRSKVYMIIPSEGPRIELLQERLRKWSEIHPVHSTQETCHEIFRAVKDTLGGYNPLVSHYIKSFEPASVRLEKARTKWERNLPSRVAHAATVVVRNVGHNYNQHDVLSATRDIKINFPWGIINIPSPPQLLQLTDSITAPVEDTWQAQKTVTEWYAHKHGRPIHWSLGDILEKSLREVVFLEKEIIDEKNQIPQLTSQDLARCIREWEASQKAVNGSVHLETIPFGMSVCADYVSLVKYCMDAMGIDHLVTLGTVKKTGTTRATDNPFNHVWITLPSEGVLFDPVTTSFEDAWLNVNQSHDTTLDHEANERSVEAGGYTYTFDYVDSSPKFRSLYSFQDEGTALDNWYICLQHHKDVKAVVRLLSTNSLQR